MAQRHTSGLAVNEASAPFDGDVTLKTSRYIWLGFFNNELHFGELVGEFRFAVYKMPCKH